MTEEAYARRLRQQIMATCVCKHGWSKDDLHDMMDQWGFGDSLRALKVARLVELLRLVQGKKEPDIPEEFQLDDQGKYLYYLMKRAGWDMGRIRALMISRFEKSDWSLLDQGERREIINIMKNYAESYEPSASAKLRRDRQKNTKKKENRG